MECMILDLMPIAKTVICLMEIQVTVEFLAPKLVVMLVASCCNFSNAWKPHYDRNFRDGKIGNSSGVRSLGVAFT